MKEILLYDKNPTRLVMQIRSVRKDDFAAHFTVMELLRRPPILYCCYCSRSDWDLIWNPVHVPTGSLVFRLRLAREKKIFKCHIGQKDVGRSFRILIKK
jgi:hypothetical protein